MVGSWKRCRSRKPFRDQRGGFRSGTISIAHKFLRWVSGGDERCLIEHLQRNCDEIYKTKPCVPHFNPHPPLPQSTRLSIENFYREKSSPMANKTTYLPATKEHIPSLYYKETVTELHSLWLVANPQLHASLSKFRALRPKECKKATKQVDMCDVCLDKSLGKPTSVHTSC